ncbi:unnamed protein product [Didymodactylos carnosus]|uniref:Fusion protein n=1 Tax=Didymodactylos carnosus TaxID=1234261 RepID=A0A814EA56_9BILA|nr:unnamed protein product [Didymodactylos carnosus]CAF3739871.1 unnamed protein product [Didymodactylos carnosus]
MNGSFILLTTMAHISMSLCELTNLTIYNNLEIFNATNYVSDVLVPQQLFDQQTDNYMKLFVSSTTMATFI